MPVRLTSDELPKMGPAFSPDGARIAYTALEGDGWNTWIVPTSSGRPRPWRRNASGLSWIESGQLLFSEIRPAGGMAIVRADASGGASRDVYVPQPLGAMAHRAQVSPDGRLALVVEMDEAGEWRPCRVVPIDGSSPGWPLDPPHAPCTAASWSADGKWMYFSANAGDGFHIWRRRFPDGRAEQITSGPTQEEGVAVAPDGRSLVTSVGLVQRSVWVRDSSGERQISVEGYAYWPLLTAGARKVCFRLARTATSGQAPSELWVADVSSGRTHRLLGDKLVTGYDLHDDRIVASVTGAHGRSRLWTAGIDGDEPATRVPTAEGDNPRFGPNGDIFFRSTEGTSMSLVRIRADGTQRHWISAIKGSVFGGVSPDGRWLSNQSAAAVMSARSTTGDAAVPIVPGVSSRLRWSADASHVYLSFQYGEASAFGYGRTYVLPLSQGSDLPRIPPGGFRSEAEIAAVPGVQIIELGDVAPGPSPDVYAFSRTTTTRNLYRIPLP